MLHLPEIVCKQQVLCTAKPNHNEAIPEGYVLVLIWTDTTPLQNWLALLPPYECQQMCALKKGKRRHTPLLCLLYFFQAVLCEIVNFIKPYITA